MDITKVYPILIGKNLECCAKYKQNCFAAKRNHVILNQWHGTLYQQQIIRIAKQLWLLSFMNCLFYFEIFSKKHSLPLWPIPAFYIILLQSPPCLNCKSDVTSNQRLHCNKNRKESISLQHHCPLKTCNQSGYLCSRTSRARSAACTSRL